MTHCPRDTKLKMAHAGKEGEREHTCKTTSRQILSN
jgi:hypothetical protein